ncbi:unnamed protein product [Penicillium palitans]
MSNGFDGAAKKVPLKVGDSKMLMFYYDTTIDYFQRPSCCAIIEAVIKSTKPRNWWPSGITNVSIEDLSKQDFVKLYVHIIHELRSDDLNAETSIQIITHAEQKLEHPGVAKVIYDLFRVRTMEARFEQDEIDATTVVYVTDLVPSSKEGGCGQSWR